MRLGIHFRWQSRKPAAQQSSAAADVALQQTIHGRAFFQIRRNFREHAFLRRSRFKRQDALQRFANIVFSHAKCNGIFLASRAAVERQLS